MIQIPEPNEQVHKWIFRDAYESPDGMVPATLGGKSYIADEWYGAWSYLDDLSDETVRRAADLIRSNMQKIIDWTTPGQIIMEKK